MINIDTLGLIFSIVTSILFWGTAFFVLIRILFVAFGYENIEFYIASKDTLIKNFVFASEKNILIDADASKSGFFKICMKIILLGVSVRLITLLLAFIFLTIEGHNASIIGIFNSFNRWDAPHYLVLADIGYSYLERGYNLFLVFFPLYPWLIRLVNIFTGNFLVAAYIVSFISYLIGLCYIYHLVKLDFSESTAWWAVILISIFPFSFFFGAPHTESVFMLTTAMTLYYIRTHRWFLAGIAGAFAANTRMVGIILVAAAAVEFVMTYKLFTLMKKEKWNEFFDVVDTKGLFILLMFIGTIVYFIINWYISGDPLRFMYYQRINWHNGFLYFGETMRMQFGRLHSISIENIIRPSAVYVHGANILAFSFCVWMCVYAAIKRHNAAYIVYAMGYTFVSYSMLWLLSGGRYATALVPVFIFLADYVQKNPRRRIVVSVIIIILFLPILRSYVLGRYIM